MSKASIPCLSGEQQALHCSNCGSDGRFEALVSFAVNLVTSNGVVVREMYSEVSGYRCADCGEDVATPEGWITTP
jgi:DNA-directed RNA polymerase subunit RPC12/RpoP